jgi:hypothetical protein
MLAIEPRLKYTQQCHQVGMRVTSSPMFASK